MGYDQTVIEEEQAAPDARLSSPPGGDLYPRSFDEFVGQAEVERLLRVEVEAAQLRRRPLAHIGFYGPPGLGKTALGHVLAGEMGMALYESSGPEYPTQKDVIQAVENIGVLGLQTGKAVLWLIDEIDGMARIASYVIHPLMTHGYVVWQGKRWAGVDVTVVGTTNRMSSVPGPLKSRFQEAIFVGFYSEAELAEVARRTAARVEVEIDEDAALWVGANAAGEPRKVNRRIMRNVANLVAKGGSERADLRTVREALELSGLRHRGLSRPQYEYLELLSRMPKETAGIASIAAVVGQDTKDVQFDVEPYLLRAGYAVVTRSGRQLTERGMEYLKEAKDNA